MINKSIKEINAMICGELYLNNTNPDDYINGVSIDSRKIEKGNIYFALKGEVSDGHLYIESAIDNGAKLIIASDVSKINDRAPFIIVDDTTRALQDLAASYRDMLEGLFIGITGSNGKTSCKDILCAALSSAYKTQKTQGNHNNELGVPLTILSFDEDSECYIVEMGMEAIGDIHFLERMVKPNVGIVTNVGTAHLTTFGSMDNIGRGKLEMMDVLKDKALFIYNGDDSILNKMIKEKDESRLTVKRFGENDCNDIYITEFSQDYKKIYFSTNLSHFTYSIEILGKHQAYNAMAAIMVCKSLNMSDEDIQKGFEMIENTGMRNELLKIKECTILNDAYKSNPQSSLAALSTFESFDSPYKIVVFADMLDLGDTTNQIHYDLGKDSLNYTYNELLLYGDLSRYTYEAVKENDENRLVKCFNTHKEIADYLRPYLNKECMILFKGSRGMALDKVIDLLKGDNDE